MPQPAGKPNSVPTVATCAASAGDDHSSSLAIARELQRPTRWLRTGRPVAPPYLVLLREGFCLPLVLPRARCALTAPFHPYPSTCAPRGAPLRGGIFSVPLIRQVALPGRYPAHCPMEFGLSSRSGTSRARARGYRNRRSSGRLRPIIIADRRGGERSAVRPAGPWAAVIRQLPA